MTLQRAAGRSEALRALDRAELDIADLLERAREASDFLKALAHESRLVILCLLAEGEKSVMELAGLLGERQPSVSQQLARLKTDGLVQARRDGKHIYYSLGRAEVADVIVALHAAFCGPTRPPPPAARRGLAGKRRTPKARPARPRAGS